MTPLILPPRNHRLSDETGTGPPRRDPAPVIDFDQLRPIEGLWYQHGDEELQLGRQLMPIETDSLLAAGRPLVRRLRKMPARVIEGANGRQRVEATTEELFFRATLHPAGTAATRLAREKAARQPKAPKPFAVVINDPPALAAQPERVRALSQGGSAIASITPSAPAIRGREPVLGWLSSRVALEVVNGHLIERTRGGVMPADVDEVLAAYGPRLLPAWLVGLEPPCDLCSAAAVVPTRRGAILCAGHA